MHRFTYNKLPFSFSEMWVTNRAWNPNVILRNVDELCVPAHHYATTKRFQFFSFRKIWNDCDITKRKLDSDGYLKFVNPNENDQGRKGPSLKCLMCQKIQKNI